jgi:DNA-binding transcriptional LysR family regulator
MAVNLPTELLRSFAAIVDSGSMLRATERVFVTQSALSLQMKRLEETVQATLFHRDGRRLALTPAGETLLSFAREMLALNDRALWALNGDMLAGPVRVGMVQDFAEVLLSGVLAQFSALNPETQLVVRVGGSHELLELLDADRLDLVLGMGPGDDVSAITTAPMRWIGNPDLAAQQVVPVAVLEPPCRFREAALKALDATGRPYRVVLETPSLSVLRAALESGLAISCRTNVFYKQEIDDGKLPALPKVAYIRHTRPSPHPTIVRLAELISSAVLSL